MNILITINLTKISIMVLLM